MDHESSRANRNWSHSKLFIHPRRPLPLCNRVRSALIPLGIITSQWAHGARDRAALFCFHISPELLRLLTNPQRLKEIMLFPSMLAILSCFVHEVSTRVPFWDRGSFYGACRPSPGFSLASVDYMKLLFDLVVVSLLRPEDVPDKVRVLVEATASCLMPNMTLMLWFRRGMVEMGKQDGQR